MSDIVYILGAGVNQVIKDEDGLSPPLINNFFHIALKKKKYLETQYRQGIQLIYDYIKKYWKKDESFLVKEPFDLEECFSLLELQLNEIINGKDKNEEENNLSLIQFRLKSLFADVISDFEKIAKNSNVMKEFGKILHDNKPIIITFNYDCLVESSLESTAIEEPKWIRNSRYGIKFDLGLKANMNNLSNTEYEQFAPKYDKNLKSFYILKLHGSLNWFRYLTPSRIHFSKDELERLSKKEKNEKKKKVILMKGDWWLENQSFIKGRYYENWLIDPIIITPILNKEKYFKWAVYERVFSTLWDNAKESLSKCKTLVVIGYSFPPTDFLTKKMFLEAFSENDLEELIVINPDTSVVQKVKDLCHFNKPVIVCKDLEEYLRYYDKNK